MKSKLLFITKSLFTVLILIFFSLNSFADLNKALSESENGEFIQCVSTQAGEKEEVLHYLVDLRNYDKVDIYNSYSVKNLKASEISDWKLIDEDIIVNEDPNFDVQFKSTKNDLNFLLVIETTDGELLSGKLVTKNSEIEVQCVDINYENSGLIK